MELIFAINFLNDFDHFFMKVLVIRFSSIGDIVLTTPVVRVLSQQIGAEVHFLTKPNMAAILAGNPYISKIISLDKKESLTQKMLKKEGYDLVIDLHNNLRSRKLTWGLGCEVRRFDKLNFQKWLYVRFKINNLPKIHIVDRYLATLSPLPWKNDGRGLDFFIAESDLVSPKILQKTFPNWTGCEQGYVALVAGAAHFTKRIPIDLLVKIARQVNGPVLLLGGPDDAAVGQEVARQVGDQLADACGKFKLGSSADLLRGARLVISSDTGLMHIAAALGKPIHAVWGNTTPELGMYPYLPVSAPVYTNVEVLGLSCRPCSKIGFDKCPKGHFKCMNEQVYKV
jgi:ADP-heptose:LPS heptosyltransferase